MTIGNAVVSTRRIRHERVDEVDSLTYRDPLQQCAAPVLPAIGQNKGVPANVGNLLSVTVAAG